MLQPEAEAAAEAAELAAQSAAAAVAERRAVSPAVVVSWPSGRTSCSPAYRQPAQHACRLCPASSRAIIAWRIDRGFSPHAGRQVRVDVYAEAGPSSGAAAQQQRVFMCGAAQTLGQLLALLAAEGAASGAVRQDIESAQQVCAHACSLGHCSTVSPVHARLWWCA
jgi:hypothetical protein